MSSDTLNTKANRFALAVRIHKIMDCASRVTSTFRHVGGATKKSRQCVLCGESCGGYSSKYPRTKRSITWEVSHDCSVMYLASRGFTGEKLVTALKLTNDARTSGETGVVLGDLIRSIVVEG